MNSNIFDIKHMSAPWEGLHYSVSWPEHGVVRRQRYVMAEQAFKTGAYQVGFSNGRECLRVNAEVVLGHSWQPEFIDHMFGSVSELRSVAFTELRYAENFVYRMEQIIAWKMLGRCEHA